MESVIGKDSLLTTVFSLDDGISYLETRAIELIHQAKLCRDHAMVDLDESAEKMLWEQYHTCMRQAIGLLGLARAKNGTSQTEN